MSSKNWATKDLGAELVDRSSEADGCEAEHLLDPSLERIWLSGPGLPQWVSIYLGNIKDKKSLVIRTVGWNCWHSFKTNPKEISLHVSSDGSKYKMWDSFHARMGSGTQLFDCAPISIAIYPYIAFEITKSFGGTNTYINRVYLYSDEIPSSPFENSPRTPDIRSRDNLNVEGSEDRPNQRNNIENLGIVESLKYTPHVAKSLPASQALEQLPHDRYRGNNLSINGDKGFVHDDDDNDDENDDDVREEEGNKTQSAGGETYSNFSSSGFVADVDVNFINDTIGGEGRISKELEVTGFPVSHSIQNLRRIYLGRDSLEIDRPPKILAPDSQSNHSKIKIDQSLPFPLSSMPTNSIINQRQLQPEPQAQAQHHPQLYLQTSPFFTHHSRSLPLSTPNSSSWRSAGFDSKLNHKPSEANQISSEIDDNDHNDTSEMHEKMRKIVIDQVIELEGILDGEININTELVNPKMIKLTKQLNESIANRELILDKLRKCKQFKLKICKKYDFLNGALL